MFTFPPGRYRHGHASWKPQGHLEDVPENARNQVRFVWLEQFDEAIDDALNPLQTDSTTCP